MMDYINRNPDWIQSRHKAVFTQFLVRFVEICSLKIAKTPISTAVLCPVVGFSNVMNEVGRYGKSIKYIRSPAFSAVIGIKVSPHRGAQRISNSILRWERTSFRINTDRTASWSLHREIFAYFSLSLKGFHFGGGSTVCRFVFELLRFSCFQAILSLCLGSTLSLKDFHCRGLHCMCVSTVCIWAVTFSLFSGQLKSALVLL